MERGRAHSPAVEPRGSVFPYRASGENLINQRAWIGYLCRRGITCASLVLLAAIFAWCTMIFRCCIGNLRVGDNVLVRVLVNVQSNAVLVPFHELRLYYVQSTRTYISLMAQLTSLSVALGGAH